MNDKAMPKDDAAACRKAFPIRISSCFLPDAKAKYVPVCLAFSLPLRSHCSRKSSKPPSDAHSSTPSRESANLPVQATGPHSLRCLSDYTGGLCNATV